MVSQREQILTAREVHFVQMHTIREHCPKILDQFKSWENLNENEIKLYEFWAKYLSMIIEQKVSEGD